MLRTMISGIQVLPPYVVSSNIPRYQRVYWIFTGLPLLELSDVYAEETETQHTSAWHKRHLGSSLVAEFESIFRRGRSSILAPDSHEVHESTCCGVGISLSSPTHHPTGTITNICRRSD